jgi:hypothetical protein
MPNRLLEATPEQVQLWLRFPPRGLRPAGSGPRVPSRGFPVAHGVSQLADRPISRADHDSPAGLDPAQRHLGCWLRLKPPSAEPKPPGRPPASKSVGQLADPSDRPTAIPPRNRQTLPNTHKSGTAERRHLLIGPVRWHIGPVLCSRWNIGPVPSPGPIRPAGTSGRSIPGPIRPGGTAGRPHPRSPAGPVEHRAGPILGPTWPNALSARWRRG